VPESIMVPRFWAVTNYVVGAAPFALANFLYPLPAALLAIIGVSVLAGGVKTVAVAYFRLLELYE
jgi:hypothetical protein